MAKELRNNGAPANVMAYMFWKDEELQKKFTDANLNDTCPCGSGLKFKNCRYRSFEKQGE